MVGQQEGQGDEEVGGVTTKQAAPRLLYTLGYKRGDGGGISIMKRLKTVELMEKNRRRTGASARPPAHCWICSVLLAAVTTLAPGDRHTSVPPALA